MSIRIAVLVCLILILFTSIAQARSRREDRSASHEAGWGRPMFGYGGGYEWGHPGNS